MGWGGTNDRGLGKGEGRGKTYEARNKLHEGRSKPHGERGILAEVSSGHKAYQGPNAQIFRTNSGCWAQVGRGMAENKGPGTPTYPAPGPGVLPRAIPRTFFERHSHVSDSSQGPRRGAVL